MKYFLCGAMARDILLLHVHGIKTGAATQDVDFGIAVETWEQFETIKATLTATGRFEAVPQIAHRLYYKITPQSSGYPIDIIPFGGVEGPPNLIEWPPGTGEVMNVMGYEEALANTVEIEVSENFVAPVISLPGLALLKLFAWADRGTVNPKDALDLAILLRTYQEAGNTDRLYGDEMPLLEAVNFSASMSERTAAMACLFANTPDVFEEPPADVPAREGWIWVPKVGKMQELLTGRTRLV